MKRWLRYRWYLFAEAWKLGIPFLGLLHADFRGKSDEDYLNFVHKTKWTWEHWILPAIPANLIAPLPMPERYLKELLANWLAGCRLSGERWIDWWYKNQAHFILHKESRSYVERYNEQFRAEKSRYARGGSRYKRA